MILLIGILSVLFLFSCWLGYRQYLRLEHLNMKNVTNSVLAGMILLTLLSIAHWMGFFTQAVAAHLTSGLYTIAAGFFIGNGTKLVVKKKQAGPIEYIQRSFWIDVAPNLIATLLIAYGIYRIGVLTTGSYTDIGITSGLSLVGFGFFGYTVRIVPELRTEGILILDQFIAWKMVLTYEWHDEGVITIDYMNRKRKICEFSTAIPPEDHLIVDRLLGRRIKEHEEERKKELRETN